MAVSEARKRANTKWNAANSKQVSVRFMTKGDKDILDHLAKQDSIAGYLRRIIREDIARSQQQD